MSAATTTTVTTRDRLIAAAEACLDQHGIRRTSMVQVAQAAGVSRAALYKHFPNRASLFVAALARTDERFWEDASERVSQAGDIGAKVAAAVRIALEHEPGPLLLRLRTEEPEAFAAIVGEGVPALVPGMTEFWRPHLEAARRAGEVRADLDVDHAAAWVMRVVVSLITMPGGDEPGDVTWLDAFVDDFVVPSLRSEPARPARRQPPRAGAGAARRR